MRTTSQDKMFFLTDTEKQCFESDPYLSEKTILRLITAPDKPKYQGNWDLEYDGVSHTHISIIIKEHFDQPLGVIALALAQSKSASFTECAEVLYKLNKKNNLFYFDEKYNPVFWACKEKEQMPPTHKRTAKLSSDISLNTD